jgi:tetratricopeptide (TPR) repeat protein
MATGDLAAAARYVERQAELAQALGLRPLIANAWYLRGAITLEHNQPGRAEEMFALSARLYHELGIQNYIGGAEADALAGQGVAAYERGDYGRACQLAEQALSMLERGRSRVMTMWQHVRAGRAALASGQLELAGQRLIQGLTLLHEHQRTGRIVALAHLAHLAGLRGDRRSYARLMGFVAAHEDAAPVQRPVWVGLDEFKRRIAEAKSRLSEPDFAAAWAEGEALDEDQAMAVARDATSHGGLAAEA